ncbi:hypothetical protein CAEBREN_17546 [Caenorhabditis brenneri]|uniref:Uncharacterized protein n=1 Tax=Caenorhabditis brenneri TaxID=135651 RepID=G0MRN8_CAEBE|nr:hypothetical protein CAEBREN_17546 [Caenorhabditis brenneri]
MSFLVIVSVALLNFVPYSAQSKLHSDSFIANCSIQHNDVADINYKRYNFSRDYNVSNMNEISWDQELERKVRKLKSCADLKHGPSYRIEKQYDEETVNAVHFFVYTTSGKESYFNDYGTFHPLQKSYIHCALTTPCPDGTTAVKMYSPRSSFSASDFKYGLPGSDCPGALIPPDDYGRLCTEGKN